MDGEAALGLLVFMKIIGVIPSRYGSTRFPGKPLAIIAGKPLIQWVVEQCGKASCLSEVIVATDDVRIQQVVKNFCKVVMTSEHHASGTDRVEEVVKQSDADAAINIQGDEPLIEPSVIEAVAALLHQNGVKMSTAATPIRKVEECENPNVVKVVTDAHGRALYFSRRTIPYQRDLAAQPAAEQMKAFPYLKHLGIYGYHRDTLKKLVRLPISSLERAEKLEQLRALENGISISVAKVEHESIGVDTPEDIARVETILKSKSSLLK